jgi:hypothetical protein
MKNKKQILFISVLMLAVLSVFALSACNDVARNVKSIECESLRGGEVVWAMKSKKVVQNPCIKRFTSDYHFIDELTGYMKELSPQYEYESYSSTNYYGGEIYVIFNNDEQYPATFLLTQSGDEVFNYTIEQMVVGNALAFPAHLLSTFSRVIDIDVKNGSTFVINGTIEQVSDFYTKNNFSVVKNGSVLEINDKTPTDREHYESFHCEPFSIEFSVINENNNLIVYHMPE